MTETQYLVLITFSIVGFLLFALITGNYQFKE